MRRLVAWLRLQLGVEADRLTLDAVTHTTSQCFEGQSEEISVLRAAIGQYAENERQLVMRVADLDARLRYYEAHDESIKSLAKKRLNGHAGTHIVRIGGS